MSIYAISDLHLSGAKDKPMDMFGDEWSNHSQKIQDNWIKKIKDNDTVLICGDTSWAMKTEDARVDLDMIGKLPGRKIFIKGNHDYWWSSLKKVRAMLPPKMQAVQNDALRFEGITVCGSRAWICPGSQSFSQEDEKIYNREVLRFRLSLIQARQMRQPGDLLIAMTHFPPFNEKREASGFTLEAEKYEVDMVLYGHLHAGSCRLAYEGERDRVSYRLVSCDHLNFKPCFIAQI